MYLLVYLSIFWSQTRSTCFLRSSAIREAAQPASGEGPATGDAPGEGGTREGAKGTSWSAAFLHCGGTHLAVKFLLYRVELHRTSSFSCTLVF